MHSNQDVCTSSSLYAILALVPTLKGTIIPNKNLSHFVHGQKSKPKSS